MSRYWITDKDGLVLGPVSEAVLRDLAEAGKLDQVHGISTDGRSYQPPSSFPALASLFGPGANVEQTTQASEAERLLQRVVEMGNQPTHALFGVAPDAGLDVHRAAFFRLAKKYHPQRLPPESPADLQTAYRQVFQLLSARMRAVEEATRPAASPVIRGVLVSETPGETERGASHPEAGTRAPPVLSGSKSEKRRSPTEVRRSPAYAVVEFLGLDRRDGRRVRIRIPVTIENAGMFSEHHLVNLSTGGFFVASDRILPLEQEVDVVLRFKDQRRDIRLSGTVVWENVEAGGDQPKGFGVKITAIQGDDLEFVRAFVREATDGA